MPLVTEEQIATPRTFAAKDAVTLIVSGKLDPFIPEARKKDAAAFFSACVQECNLRDKQYSAASVGQCLASSAKLWLPPGLPESFCHFVPRKGELVWTRSYKGVINLAYRSGFLVRLDGEYVLKGEKFRYRHTSDKGVRIFHEIPANRREFKMEDLECVYCTWQTKDGAVSGFVVPGWKVVKLRDKSDNSSPWRTNPDAMGRKTAFNHAAQYLPLGEDFALSSRLDAEDIDEPPLSLIDVPATDPRASDKSAASAAAMLRMLTSDVEQQGRIRQWILSQSSSDGTSEDLAVCKFLSDQALRDSAQAFSRSCCTADAAT